MTKEEKHKFVITALEKESKRYIQNPLAYNTKEEIWLDKYLTNSNFENSLKEYENNLELVYQVVLSMQ
jgi:hypothetical protein